MNTNSYHRKSFNKKALDKNFVYFLTLLIATDLAFIALGIIYECGFINLADVCTAINFDSYFSLTRDRGYAEIFQYLKEYWLIILFGFLAITQSLKIYSGWAFLATYILIDDACEIHENLGSAIAKKFNYISWFNLRPEDYGELTVFFIVGAVFFLWLINSYRWGNSSQRKFFRYLIEILFGLAVFGVFIDVFHVFLDRYVFWKSALAIVEDGGEHIMMSIFVCFVLSVTINLPKNSNSYSKEKIKA